MMKTLFALLLLAAATPHAFAREVAPSDGPATAVVNYADLNLREPAGADALRHRIDQTVLSLSDVSGSVDQAALDDLAAARARGHAQAECLIAAANAHGGTGS